MTDKYCYVCLDNDDTGGLVRSCVCKDLYSHPKCLNKWVATSKKDKCGVCGNEIITKEFSLLRFIFSTIVFPIYIISSFLWVCGSRELVLLINLSVLASMPIIYDSRIDNKYLILIAAFNVLLIIIPVTLRSILLWIRASYRKTLVVLGEN